MTEVLRGYSDRINHALAFAAKHHDQRVRRGTRGPYFSEPANVALILTRFRCEEPVVVAGILRDVVADYVREGATGDVLDERIGEKFGHGVLATCLAVSERKHDDEGVELASEDRRTDLVGRLVTADAPARWVAAAGALHAAATLLADLRRTVDHHAVWSRNAGGRPVAMRWLRRLHQGLETADADLPVVRELGDVLAELERQPD